MVYYWVVEVGEWVIENFMFSVNDEIESLYWMLLVEVCLVLSYFYDFDVVECFVILYV